MKVIYTCKNIFRKPESYNIYAFTFQKLLKLINT